MWQNHLLIYATPLADINWLRIGKEMRKCMIQLL